MQKMIATVTWLLLASSAFSEEAPRLLPSAPGGGGIFYSSSKPSGSVGGGQTFNGGQIGGQGQYPGAAGGGDSGGSSSSSSNVVAFTATKATANTQSAPSQIRFENTLTDVGYGWDSREGVFQCYHPGTYVFSWSAVSPSASQFRITLTLNGREVAHAWAEEHGYTSGSNTVALTLQRGDRVTLEITEGKLYEPNSSQRGYTTFTGYKLN